MALPQLYRNLILTSYDKIRYVGDQPEGMGSASPFSMGLNAVITRPYASLVRSLTLRGDWREQELEEHARVGRVPDSSMMLNIAVRAAVDRMRDLEDFRWELSTKMLETVYLGLAQLPKLTSLTIRFPSSRHPRPTTVIPAMPHLRYLKITDIDPLCYPDDISTLLYKARKLRKLKMHWSPRMRNMQEPSVMLHDYFRKCISAKQPLALKSLGLSNLYARHSEDFNAAFDNGTVEEVTMLHEVRSELANLNTFVDSTWPAAPPNKPMRLKSLRANVFNQRQAEFLGSFTGLERIYLVSSSTVSDSLNSPREPAVACPSAATLTPPASENTNLNAISSRDLIMSADSPSNLPALQARARDTSINSIVLNHAATLRHLLLPARWALSSSIIARLVHASPQLEQLAFAAEISSMDTLGLLLPFLRNLRALRILVPTSSLPSESDETRNSQLKPPTSKPCKDTDGLDIGARSFAEFVELDDEILIERLGEALADQQLFQRLKVVGFGRKGFVLGEYYTVPVDRPPPQPQPPRGVQSQTPAASRAPSAEGKSPLSYVDLEQSQTNGVNPGLPSPGLNQNHIQPTTTSPKFPRSQQRKNTFPPSTLGKRTRDEDSSVEPVDQPSEPGPCPKSRPGTCPGPGSAWNMNEGLNLDLNDCLLPGPRNRALRRRIQRVGWDVLKQWEIWGLDTQEL
ncbi:hypothetical protein BDV10DRAFT_166640 [Aspergillus recurvatus]